MSRFSCPVSWCLGLRADHGGDGGSPESWLHTGRPIELAGGMQLIQEQLGGEADVWALYVDEGEPLRLPADVLASALARLIGN